MDVAAGLVRLFAPAKRCRVGGSGELLVACSDSEDDLEVCGEVAGPPRGAEARGRQRQAAADAQLALSARAPEERSPEEESEQPAAEEAPADPGEVPVSPRADLASEDVPATLEVVQEHERSSIDARGPADSSLDGAGCAELDSGPDGERPGQPPSDTELEEEEEEADPADGRQQGGGGGSQAVPAAVGLFEEFKFDGPMGRSPGPRTPYSQARGRPRGSRPTAGGLTPPPGPAKRGPRCAKRSSAAARGRGAEKAEEDFASAPAELRCQVLQKWRDVAGLAATPEQLRLQLLVAAILHPKTSEGIVRGSMAKLLAWAEAHQDPSLPRGLSAKLLAGAEPQVLEELWEGLHWHKVKAARVVAAAAALEADWGGSVPLQREQLLKLPGIGPKLANILAFVCDGLAPARTGGSQPAEVEEVEEVG